MKKDRLAVLGLGNILRGDDGIGVRLVKELTSELSPSPLVELIDAGVGGLRLLNWFDDASAVLAVDSAQMNLTPGSHQWIIPSQLASKQDIAFTLHDLDFAQTLWYAEKFFSRPPTVIFAIQPQTIDQSERLSQPLNDALPHLLNHLRQALENWTSQCQQFQKALTGEAAMDQKDKLLLACLSQRTESKCTNTN
ncbi:MAG: hydrogenase maturation protease [Phycisphaerae bacterium]